MNTIRKRALLWEQQSQEELNQTLRAFANSTLKVFNLGLFLIWSGLKFLTNLFFWLLAGSRPVINFGENQYRELNEVYPTAFSEPATQINHLSRKA